ncbi:MAG: tryptophan 7-halogenase [Phycisphaerales bacterium]|nr:tryptophan 7-halogenase [Phycisphaerales bacterium]
MSDSYDCIVIGGGPAGSTTATLLADYGYNTLVLERSRFPRHHIGESLMPQTYWTFKRLGMLDKMKRSSFVRKESVQFVSGDGQESAPFYFTDRDPNEWSSTWQVRRDEFDAMMLTNAQEHGVKVRERAKVSEVLFEGSKAIGVRVVIDGKTTTLMSKVVVDATGQSGLLSRQLNARYADPRLKNASIYAHYRGGLLDDGRNAGATVILHTKDQNGWFWYIPLKDKDNLVSVGVVAPPSYLCSGRGDDPAETLAEEIENCPGIRKRLANAERVSQAYVTADFSYRSRRVAGDGWVLVGDAFGFLDPVYSSGVMLALKSGEYAADAIHAALETNDPSGVRLGRFGPRLTAGMHNIRQLVYAFYDKNFSIGRFVREHPQYADHIVRILIGDVFNDDVSEVFEAMKNTVALPDPIQLEESVTV